jgi:2-desacetyl-2-hydroxyethyl bacteriochlorophyllide A dehydrogenase
MVATPRPGSDRLMRAAQIVGPGQVRIAAVAIPDPTPHEVRLRVQGCAVSSATSAAWLGLPSFQYPLLPGELGCEAWGVVDAVGSDVEQPRIGQRVAVLGQYGFAEYDVVDAKATLVLPDSGVRAFPGGSLAGAVNTIERSRIIAGQTVAVVGVGFLGAVLIRLAVLAGARVLALSRRPFSLAVGLEMGASSVIEVGDAAQAVAEVSELTQGGLCETVIEATGQQQPLSLASRLVADRGSLVIAGRHHGVREVDLGSWGERGIDVINTHERRWPMQVAAMRSALEIVEAGNLDLASLCTHHYPLEQLPEALRAAHSRPLGFIKAIVDLD